MVNYNPKYKIGDIIAFSRTGYPTQTFYGKITGIRSFQTNTNMNYSYNTDSYSDIGESQVTALLHEVKV